MTMNDLLKGIIKDRPLWNIQIWGPISLEDKAEVEVVLLFGETKVESKEVVKFNIVPQVVDK